MILEYKSTMHNKKTYSSLVLRDFYYLPALMLLQIGTYLFLFRQFKAEDNFILIPCLLLAVWMLLSFIFRRGTTLLQLIILILVSVILGFFSLLLVSLLFPSGSPVVYLILGFVLLASIVFGILFLFRVKGLVKSTPSFLFALCTGLRLYYHSFLSSP